MPDVLKRVGRYDLLEVIGRGGAAVVYLARQRDLQRHVALKELAPYYLADTSFAERFVEESRLAGAMSHANVVTVHEFFEDGAVPYIAMEYLPHGSLRQYVGHLSTAQIAGVLEGVLAGLSHGEAHGVVHRDLKPENLLVATDGRVKIADFGVARAYSKAATRNVVTVAGTTIGTPAYMSPEQALGTDLTPATDLYSLGVVAWELLTGQVPFEENDTPVAVLYRHVHEEVPPVRSVAPEVDEGIALWLGKMLAKRPEDRYQSADESWMALEDVVLDLLGPRWRREARLVVGGSARRARTLTPAPLPGDEQQTPDALVSGGVPPAAEGDPAPAEELHRATPVPAVPRAPVAQTVDDLEPPATIAPRKRPERSHTTLFRIARRHGDGGDQDETVPTSSRRRLVVAGIVVAMAGAAAGGVALAGSGSNDNAARAAAQRRLRLAQEHRIEQEAQAKAQAVTAANDQLRTVFERFSVTRNQALVRLNNATTQHAQATDAAAVQKVYASAARSAAAFDAKTPLAKPLSTTFGHVAGDYGRLAAAARTGSARRYHAAAARISTDEAAMRGDLTKL